MLGPLADERRGLPCTAFVEGDSLQRYDRAGMRVAMAEAARAGNAHFSHFGPEANLFDELEALFRQYGERGGPGDTCTTRTRRRPAASQAPSRKWEEIPAGTDLLFYEGLHGGIVTERVNVARYPDLLVGVVPS